MKRLFRVSLISFIVLVGCLSSTTFHQWTGPDTFEGPGGSFTTVDGIDVFSAGAPNKKFKLLGFAENQIISGAEFESAFGSSMATSKLVKKAKEVGGDAILLLASQKEILGYHTQTRASGTTAGAYSDWGGGYGTFRANTYSQGRAQTSATVSNRRVAAIIKYLE